MSTPDDLEQKKALLLARAEYDRLHLELTARALRERIALPSASGSGPSRSASLLATAMVALGVPLVGRTRLLRWMKLGSIGLTLYRIVRQWRPSPRSQD